MGIYASSLLTEAHIIFLCSKFNLAHALQFYSTLLRPIICTKRINSAICEEKVSALVDGPGPSVLTIPGYITQSLVLSNYPATLKSIVNSQYN